MRQSAMLLGATALFLSACAVNVERVQQQDSGAEPSGPGTQPGTGGGGDGLIQLDGGLPGDSGFTNTNKDSAVQSDAFVQQDTLPSCTAADYPSGPYGSYSNTIIQNHSFDGWFDDDGDGNVLEHGNQLRTDAFSLDQYHCMQVRGEAKLLLLNISTLTCPSCQQERIDINRAGGIYDTFHSQGVEFAEVLWDCWGQTVEVDKTAVGADCNRAETSQYVGANMPVNIIIRLSDMRIRSMTEGWIAQDMSTWLSGFLASP